MKKWSESLDDMTFEGKESVMEYISREEQTKETILNRISRLLETEIEIPLAPVVAASVGFILVVTLQLKSFDKQVYSYDITVVNEWGQYENY